MMRGLLVLAVILGHFAEITGRDSFATWLGAGIRMPLFIGLSGYLYRLERSRATPLPALLRGYRRRLVLPWFIACLIHLTLVRKLDVLTPVAVLFWPPFHLWFVPVLLAFMLAARVARGTPAAMLGFAIPISIASMYLFGVGHVTAHIPEWMPDRRFFIYPIYFYYGLLVAHRAEAPWKYRAAAILAPVGFIWWCSLYHAASVPTEVAAGLTSCIPLICLLPRLRAISFTLPPLAAIGRDSLFFYLWHPLVFGLWDSAGVTGAPMLILSIATLALLRPLLARSVAASRILGIAPRPLPIVFPPAKLLASS